MEASEDFKTVAMTFREELKELEERARNFTKAIKAQPSEDFGNKSEVIAQATLAMRHIEDARMRYGKVIQYVWDGVSKYDK